MLETAQRLGLTKAEYDVLVKKLGRVPTLEETAVMGAMWSEHCSYKSSKVHLSRFHTSEPWVIQGPGENAGIVALNDDWALAFKMESHNHPSFIEPYQGAATGVGGILRDVFCMGARPIAAANALRFGVGAGTERLVKGVVRGIGDYGNSFGVPTVAGQTSFDERYSQNILVNAFAAGVVHRQKIFRSTVAVGNVLIYFGQPTGRDGVHGATMSSDEFSEGTQTLKPTVQVGCPFSEKKLLEATLSLLSRNLVVGLQDMGAAGLTSSGAEMASRSRLGALIDLENVPMRAANLKPFELLLSESQERMLCAVEPQHVDEVVKFLSTADVSYSVIGVVTTSQRFQCRWHGTMVVDLPNELIDEAPARYHAIQPRDEYLAAHTSISLKTQTPLNTSAHEDACTLSFDAWLTKYPETFETLCAHQNFCDRESLTEHYDSSVQGQTIVGCQSVLNGNAALVRLPPETQTDSAKNQAGVAIAVGCKEHWIELDPLKGAALTVLHLSRKIRAVGATPIAMTDCLNFGSLSQPSIARQFSDAVDGITEAGRTLKIPVVSGNVSLNNQTNGQAILPTPMIGMVGTHHDVRHFFKSALNHESRVTLFALTCQKPEFYKVSLVALTLSGKMEANALPTIDYSVEQRSYELLNHLKECEPTLVSSCGKGGLALTVEQMARDSRAEISWLTAYTNAHTAAEMFSEGQNQWIIGFQENSRAAVNNFQTLIQGEGFTLLPIATLEKTNAIKNSAAGTQLQFYFKGA